MVRDSGLDRSISYAAGEENHLISLAWGEKHKPKFSYQVGRQMPSTVVIRKV